MPANTTSSRKTDRRHASIWGHSTRGSAQLLAIMLTRRCDIACGHCSVVSGPDVRGEPSEAELLERVRAAAAAGMRAIQLTGGEPMLREEIALAMAREAKRLGMMVAMTTNASWGTTAGDARRRLHALVGAGLAQLTVSYDRWHEEHLGLAPVLHVAEAAAEIALPIQINVVRAADDREVGGLAERLAHLPNVRIRFYDAQPVGRAKAFDDDSLRAEMNGFCRTAWFPALTDDGRLTACNGPAYFSRAGSPLVVGATRETPLSELVERHRDDPILQTIRAFGPTRLRTELERLPGFATFPFRDRYRGICDLCLHITSDPRAVGALRARFADPRRSAERAAALRVIEEERVDGSLGTRFANGLGAARLFFQASRMARGGLAPGADRVLGRADLDWKRRADYLVACGLARPLAHLADDPELARWAPRFFLDEIRRAGTRSAVTDLVKREALEHIDRALVELGVPGVLLKGSALLAATAASGTGALRGTGDIDLVVAPPAAAALRQSLLAREFLGERDAPRSAAHHLAPISFRGVALEIHERIMPRTFGLPEAAMLARSRKAQGTAAISVLDDEAFTVHALVHCTAHVFALGLKTAWDVGWAIDRNPGLDWERIVAWAEASAMPRAFWTPLRPLAEGLGLAVPRAVLERAPRDRRQKALDTIARERIFTAFEGPYDLNPFSKTAVFLLLCESWLARGGYAMTIARGDAAEARRHARTHVASQSLRRLPRQLREAAFHWRAFRAAGRA